jgi:hypothetical protein
VSEIVNNHPNELGRIFTGNAKCPVFQILKGQACTGKGKVGLNAIAEFAGTQPLNRIDVRYAMVSDQNTDSNREQKSGVDRGMHHRQCREWLLESLLISC